MSDCGGNCGCVGCGPKSALGTVRVRKTFRGLAYYYGDAAPVDCAAGMTPDINGVCCPITAMNSDGTCGSIGSGTAQLSIDTSNPSYDVNTQAAVAANQPAWWQVLLGARPPVAPSAPPTPNTAAAAAAAAAKKKEAVIGGGLALLLLGAIVVGARR
jgi:hypothetical protein